MGQFNLISKINNRQRRRWSIYSETPRWTSSAARSFISGSECFRFWQGAIRGQIKRWIKRLIRVYVYIYVFTGELCLVSWQPANNRFYVQIFSTTNLRSHYACIFVLLSPLFPFLVLRSVLALPCVLGKGVKNGEAWRFLGSGLVWPGNTIARVSSNRCCHLEFARMLNSLIVSPWKYLISQFQIWIKFLSFEYIQKAFEFKIKIVSFFLMTISK